MEPWQNKVTVQIIQINYKQVSLQGKWHTQMFYVNQIKYCSQHVLLRFYGPYITDTLVNTILSGCLFLTSLGEGWVNNTLLLVSLSSLISFIPFHSHIPLTSLPISTLLQSFYTIFFCCCLLLHVLITMYYCIML